MADQRKEINDHFRQKNATKIYTLTGAYCDEELIDEYINAGYDVHILSEVKCQENRKYPRSKYVFSCENSKKERKVFIKLSKFLPKMTKIFQFPLCLMSEEQN